jgi:hypothetical protein
MPVLLRQVAGGSASASAPYLRAGGTIAAVERLRGTSMSEAGADDWPSDVGGSESPTSPVGCDRYDVSPIVNDHDPAREADRNALASGLRPRCHTGRRLGRVGGSLTTHSVGPPPSRPPFGRFLPLFGQDDVAPSLVLAAVHIAAVGTTQAWEGRSTCTVRPSDDRCRQFHCKRCLASQGVR